MTELVKHGATRWTVTGAMPDDTETTTIEVRRETWQQLNARKEGPGDSFDDVIQRLLSETDE